MNKTPETGWNPPVPSIVQFGPFELDLRKAKLRKNGTRIRLQDQPFQILCILLESPGQVVTREELYRRLWPNGTIVEFEHSINAAVRRLRETLGDSAENPRYIATVARQGYRFIGDLSPTPEKPRIDSPAPSGLSTNHPDDLAGHIIAHYRVLAKLGSGGMGVIYRAADLKLGREVAVKVLPERWTEHPAALERFEREARAASALNHPNICTIYGMEQFAGQLAIVMELVEGQTLAERLAQGSMSAVELLGLSIPIASALAAAHAKGIIHRDIKPTNIMLTTHGQPKLLDFGLAKSVQADAAAVPELTEKGTRLGSISYMSPEQARGQELDTRSDLFSFGVVLYQAACGRMPFQGEHFAATLHSIIYDQPKPPRELQPDLPPAIERVILRCLEKEREQRYSSAASLLEDLRDCQDRIATQFRTRMRFPAPRIALPVLIGFVLVFTILGSWYYRRSTAARWARNVALVEAARLVDGGNEAAALPWLHKALRILPRDPALNRLLHEIAYPVPIHTTPSGANVHVKPYADPDGEWLFIGQSPLEGFLLPLGNFRWKIDKPGFRTVEGAASIQSPIIDFVLDAEGSIPSDMVHVPHGIARSFDLERVAVDDFWMDKFEVTNRQFKQFIDQGGYQNRRYWRQPFIKDTRVLSWEQAMAEFRDNTGRPGPSTWEVGNYPPGQDDFPVAGVSWYEASAYAEFAKKQIPTVYHWLRAADPGIYSDILQFSNFEGNGPARVGSFRGVGPFGTYDMAGNVREWCWNGTGDLRYILGGGWNEDRRFYPLMDAGSPFDRSPANGFRCARYGDRPLADALTQPVVRSRRDYRTEKPVSDSEFRLLASSYSYDRTELKAVTERVKEQSLYWRTERIAFDAAYEHQRITAWLYLPTNGAPPYQTIVFAPAGHSRGVPSIDEGEIKRFEFLMRSGRAVLLPEYQGTFGRRMQNFQGPSGARDRTIEQCKDLRRSVDYLETRTDIAHDRLGFYGISGGAELGLLSLPLEPRIRAAALAEGGFSADRRPPEVDGINFAPRFRIPVLMLNGRYDFVAPLETCQIPMFRLLGTSEKDKRHVLFNTGHAGPPQQYIKETLDWFDRYLGPVTPAQR